MLITGMSVTNYGTSSLIAFSCNKNEILFLLPQNGTQHNNKGCLLQKSHLYRLLDKGHLSNLENEGRHSYLHNTQHFDIERYQLQLFSEPNRLLSTTLPELCCKVQILFQYQALATN